MSVHWAVEAPKGPTAGTAQVELTARLTGPSATVDELKAAGTAGELTFTAVPVRPSGAPGERPVSTILIGSDARPGYYNLVTAVTRGAGSQSGASIVRVVAKA